MKSVLNAALGTSVGRVLVIDPAPWIVLELARRRQTTSVLVATPSRRVAQRAHQALDKLEPMSPPVSIIQLSLAAVPLIGQLFELVILANGLGIAPAPLEALHNVRRLVQPGGRFLVFSRAREGAIGGATSLLSRALRRGILPKSSDVTSWLLLSGMRSVRQAQIPHSVVPATLTWAEVRDRPWEATGATAQR